MPDVLASVARLCALARVGSVTIRATSLDSIENESVNEGFRALRDAMQAHGVEAIDIAGTIIDAEFLKLAGILSSEPSIVAGAIVEMAEALSIWNVRLRAFGAALRPTPRGMHSIAEPAPAMPEPQAITPAPVAKVEPQGDRLSADELQLLVEQLLDSKIGYNEGHALLDSAGAPGARAVFVQLVAATDISERRFLYDLAASLKGISEVAKSHAQDPRWYVVRNAAGLMGESGNPDMVVELSKVLRHDDQRVRIAAVVALGQLGGAIALARLESVLFDPSIEVRNRALSIVFASPENAPPPSRVLMALEEENALEYRLEMVAALANVQTARARARLEAFARKANGTLDDHQVRLEALAALAAGHRSYSEGLLREMLDDVNPYVRERAAALLAA